MTVRTILDKLSIVLCVIACVAILAMMFLMVGDALSRKLIGSIPGGYNTTMALLTLVLFLPQGYAQMKRSHITIDLVTARINPEARAVLRIITTILAILVFAILTWACGQKAFESTMAREEWMGLIYYPAWPFRWMLPLGLGLFTLQLIVTVVDEVKAYLNLRRA